MTPLDREASATLGPLQFGLAFLFDMDGVIVDSNPVHREAWTRFNLRYGLPTTDDMFERMYGRRNDEIVRDFFGGSLSEEEVAARSFDKDALYREIIAERLEEFLVPGLREFLAKYRDVPMGVASNAEPETVEFILDRAGLRSFFSVVLDGRQVRNPKPHPDIYLLAADRLGIDAGRCIVFEDSPSGTTAGAAAGMKVVGLATTFVNLPGVVLTVDNFLSGSLESWLQEQLSRA